MPRMRKRNHNREATGKLLIRSSPRVPSQNVNPLAQHTHPPTYLFMPLSRIHSTMIPVPWSSTKAQWLWSLPVLALAAYAVLCMMLSTTTSFPIGYTFPKALATLVHFDLREATSKYHIDAFVGTLVCVAVYIAWWMIAIRKRSRVMTRKVVLWLMFSTFACGVLFFIVANPTKWNAPFMIIPVVVFNQVNGETYQEGPALFGALGYAWLPPALALIATMFKSLPQPKCPSCGYSTDGLLASICPECGVKMPPSTTQKKS